MGKIFLTDEDSEGMLQVQMTNVQAEDSGLYRCVIYQPPKDPIILFYPVRLVVTNCEWLEAGMGREWGEPGQVGGGEQWW